MAERASTLEVHTYACAIRTALRRGRLFLSVDRLLGLRLPAGARIDAYKDATETILNSVGLNRYAITVLPAASKPGQIDASDAIYTTRHRSAVIVLIQDGAEIPIELNVGLDEVVDVAPINPRHLVAAAKSSAAMQMPLEMARKLATYPPSTLFLALRPGRSLDIVLEKLAMTKEPVRLVKPKPWEPRIEDLEGYGDAKQWALDLIVDLKDWREDRIRWDDVSSGLLLSGPPGTGKTMFAAALARSCGANFIATSSAQWQSKGHLGDMLRAMRRSFNEAELNGPTVLLIDEIDSIGDRGAFVGHNVDYNIEVVNALLELLDGSGGRPGVVVVGATNFPDKVDPALRRPGRLDRHFALQLPDLDTRAQIVELHLGDQAIGPDALRTIATATVGRSGADLKQYVADAKRQARRQKRAVQAADILGLVPPLKPLVGEERRIASVHESGHAAVGLALSVAEVRFLVVVRQKVTGQPTQGYVEWDVPAPTFRNRQSYLDKIAMLLGGIAAEKVFFGDHFDGAGGFVGSDLQLATDLATLMVAVFGMGDTIAYTHALTPDLLQRLRENDADVREQVERLLSEQLARACEIVTQKRSGIERLVAELEDCDVIPGSDVRAVVFQDAGARLKDN
ncbi:AAA family ATPase [Rhizobium johnstonii]|uniref:AAA family ATPase n=1 Tax=Rhizobium johnstonii TaxID=3019933 RepID=UPI003F98D5B2